MRRSVLSSVCACPNSDSAENRVLAPFRRRHLGAKIMLDANPGNFEGPKQLLRHKNIKSTLIYAGIDNRRAGRHHQALIDKAVARQMPQPRRGRKKREIG